MIKLTLTLFISEIYEEDFDTFGLKTQLTPRLQNLCRPRTNVHRSSLTCVNLEFVAQARTLYIFYISTQVKRCIALTLPEKL